MPRILHQEWLFTSAELFYCVNVMAGDPLKGWFLTHTACQPLYGLYVCFM